MNARGKKRLAGLAAFVLVCVMLLSCAAVSVLADDTTIDVRTKNRNIMLVVDASGSLTKNWKGTDGATNAATDPDGYRYDALNLFLGLLPDDGNNVGAIVFDDEVRTVRDVEPLQGEDARRDLYDEICAECQSAGGDTNLGEALDTAVTALVEAQKQNGYDSVVVLMTDGHTDLDDDPSKQTSDETKSLQAEMDAIADAGDHDIQVYTVYLNAINETSNSEIEDIRNGTDGEAQSVSNAEELTEVYDDFYSVIFELNGDVPTLQVDENGHAETSVFVPSIGVTDLKIAIYDADADITLTDPSGNTAQASEWSGQTFKMLSVAAPESGVWTVSVDNADTDVKLSLVFDNNLGLDLSAGNGPFYTNTDITFTSNLYESSTPIDAQQYDGELSAELVLCCSGAEEARVPMTPASDGSYTCVCAPQQQASYTAYVELSITDSNDYIMAKSGEITFDVNPWVDNNTPPVVNPDETTIKIDSSLTGKVKEGTCDLSQFFSDPDGDTLTYEVESAMSKSGKADYSDALSISGSTLTYSAGKNAIETNATAIIVAQDDSGAQVRLTVKFVVRNIAKVVVISGTAVLLIAAAVLAALAVYIATRRFNGTLVLTAIVPAAGGGFGSFGAGGVPGMGGMGASTGFGGGMGGYGTAGGAFAGGGEDNSAYRQEAFRGTKTLGLFRRAHSFPCGLDDSTKFQAVGPRTVKLKSKRPFYMENMRDAQGALKPLKSQNMTTGCSYRIYDSPECKSGINVKLEPRRAGRGGGAPGIDTIATPGFNPAGPSFGPSTGPSGGTGFGPSTGPSGGTGFGPSTGPSGGTGFGPSTGPSGGTGFGQSGGQSGGWG